MPDPIKQTVSSTEVAALVNRSPYYTRWSLWQKFAKGLDIPRDADDGRLKWGKLLQPLVLNEVVERARYDRITPNVDDEYIRRGSVGATLDSFAFDPSRGHGSIEVKCVFDYRVWMEKWGGGEYVPPEYELQLQTQLHVGDGNRPFEWGEIVVWLAGELHFFKRQRDPEIGAQIERDARVFLDEVAVGLEPDPLAVSIEAPIYAKLWYPVKPEPQTIDDPSLWQTIKEYEHFQAQAKFHEKNAEAAKAKLLATARDYAETRGPNCKIEIKRTLVAESVSVRKEHVRTTLKVAAWGDDPTPKADAAITA